MKTAIAIDHAHDGQNPSGLTALVGGLERDDLRDLRAKRLGVHDSDLRRAVVVATAESAPGPVSRARAITSDDVRELSAQFIDALAVEAGASNVEIGIGLNLVAERVRRMRAGETSPVFQVGHLVALTRRMPTMRPPAARALMRMLPELCEEIARLVSGK